MAASNRYMWAAAWPSGAGNGKPSLVAVEDTAYGAVEFAYDGLGRLVAETNPQGTIRYRYDAAGLPVSVTLPDGTEATYGYDQAGQLAGVDNPHAAVEVGARDEAGRVTRLQLPNGITAGYRFSQAGQLESIDYRHGDQDLGDLTYVYDRNGRRAGASGNLATTALPDPFAAAVFDAGNRLETLGEASFAYDEAGNLIDDGTSNYTWDARGQLVAVDGPVTATFAYDPFGRRVAKTIDGHTTNYLWDGDNLVQQAGPEGSVTSLLTGLGLDQHYAATVAGSTGTYLTDIQGSVLAQAGPGGQITAPGPTPRTACPASQPRIWWGTRGGSWTRPGCTTAPATTTPGWVGSSPKTPSATKPATPTCTPTPSATRSTTPTPPAHRPPVASGYAPQSAAGRSLR